MGNSGFRVIEKSIVYKKAHAFKYKCSFTVWYTDKDLTPMSRYMRGFGNTKLEALSSAYRALLQDIDLIQLEIAS